jgi:hypothetical protein
MSGGAPWRTTPGKPPRGFTNQKISRGKSSAEHHVGANDQQRRIERRIRQRPHPLDEEVPHDEIRFEPQQKQPQSKCGCDGVNIIAVGARALPMHRVAPGCNCCAGGSAKGAGESS